MNRIMFLEKNWFGMASLKIDGEFMQASISIHEKVHELICKICYG